MSADIAAFEAWAASDAGPCCADELVKIGNGQYRNSWVQDVYDAWQAGRASTGALTFQGVIVSGEVVDGGVKITIKCGYLPAELRTMGAPVFLSGVTK